MERVKTDGNQKVDNVHAYGTGLTKREYFAAMAMQGLLANSENSRNPVHANTAAFISAMASAVDLP